MLISSIHIDPERPNTRLTARHASKRRSSLNFVLPLAPCKDSRAIRREALSLARCQTLKPMGSRFLPDPRQQEQIVIPLHRMHLEHQTGHTPFGSITRPLKFVLPVPSQYAHTCRPLPWQWLQRLSVASTLSTPSTLSVVSRSWVGSSTYGSPRRVSTIRCRRGLLQGSASGRENGVHETASPVPSPSPPPPPFPSPSTLPPLKSLPWPLPPVAKVSARRGGRSLCVCRDAWGGFPAPPSPRWGRTERMLGLLPVVFMNPKHIDGPMAPVRLN